MSRCSFTVVAKWDHDAKVYISESDIIGFHIEADTMDEFVALVNKEAPDLIVANHMSKPELARSNIRDLIPSILLRTQELNLVTA
jgi:hypothetical protein